MHDSFGNDDALMMAQKDDIQNPCNEDMSNNVVMVPLCKMIMTHPISPQCPEAKHISSLSLP